MHEQNEAERRIRPIQYWFVIRTIPEGGAPLEIKKQWVDIPLPCRQPFVEGNKEHVVYDVTDPELVKLVKDGVAVEAYDALAALMLFDRADAASWWNNYLEGMNETLVFQASEGQLLSTHDAERILPGLSRFDEYDGYWL